jgi:hypothetical protein
MRGGNRFSDKEHAQNQKADERVHAHAWKQVDAKFNSAASGSRPADD